MYIYNITKSSTCPSLKCGTSILLSSSTICKLSSLLGFLIIVFLLSLPFCSLCYDLIFLLQLFGPHLLSLQALHLCASAHLPELPLPYPASADKIPSLPLGPAGMSTHSIIPSPITPVKSDSSLEEPNNTLHFLLLGALISCKPNIFTLSNEKDLEFEVRGSGTLIQKLPK